MRSFHIAGLALLLALEGCVLPPPGSNPPVTMQSQGTYQDNHPPESPNSLPLGSEVVAPFTSPTGQLNSVPVPAPAPFPFGRPRS